MMGTVIADLIIELNVECPYCDHHFDILTETDLNDEGALIRDAINDDRWDIPSSERIECNGVVCPYCKKEFNVKGLNW